MRKNYSLFFALLTFIFVFIATYNVYLFGDDYYYITFTQGNFENFITHHINHYKFDNGRAIVHFLVSIFLSVNLIWWKLFNSFMLASIVYFGSRISSKNTLISGLIFFLGVCAIGINVSRQSIYWLTGSFNYVYPLFLLFSYWYFLLKYKEKKKNTILMCLFSFLASATVEQGAMMVLGLNTLLGIQDLLINKKIDRKYLMILISSLLGASSVILSPATFIRYTVENHEELSFGIKIIYLIKYLINSYIFSIWMIPFNLSFILLGMTKFKNIFIKIFLFSSVIVLIYGVFSNSLNSVIDIGKIFEIIYIVLSYGLITLKIILEEFKEMNKSSLKFSIATILFIGSQLMLVVSSTYGDRNLLFGIFMLILMIAYLANDFDIKQFYLNSYALNIAIFLISFIAIKNQITIINGYYKSHIIELENIKKINSNNSKELLLEKPDINYTWSMPYVSDYHKYYYKIYYHLEDKNVIWK